MASAEMRAHTPQRPRAYAKNAFHRQNARMTIVRVRLIASLRFPHHVFDHHGPTPDAMSIV